MYNTLDKYKYKSLPRVKRLEHETRKGYLLLLNSKGNRYYFYEKSDTGYKQRIIEGAISQGYDVLECLHDVKLTPEQWSRYYYSGAIDITEANIYEMDTLFIDIDLPLWEHYYQLRKAIKELKLQNYEIWESATGNIHVYIKIKKTSDKKAYRNIMTLLQIYFLRYGLKIDDCTLKPSQNVYTEGVRILKKQGNQSKRIGALSKAGKRQSITELKALLMQRGITARTDYKRCMNIIREVVQQSQEPQIKVSINKLSKDMGITPSTLNRALQKLQEAKAIRYESQTGRRGGIVITSYNMDRIQEAIQEQFTRKQYFFMYKVRYLLFLAKMLKNLVKVSFDKLCDVLKEWFRFFSLRSINNDIKRGGCVSLGRGSPIEFLDLTFSDVIRRGERNKKLVSALVMSYYQYGLESIEATARAVFEKFEQPEGDVYSWEMVKPVIRWCVNSLGNSGKVV